MKRQGMMMMMMINMFNIFLFDRDAVAIVV